MNAPESPSPENPEKRDVTGFLKALLLGATLAATAQEAPAAIAPGPEGKPASDLSLRLAQARTLLVNDAQSGPAALIPGSGEAGSPQELWWRNWGNWHPGWGNGGWRNGGWGNFHPGWGNGGWGNGGWHNWHNWHNF